MNKPNDALSYLMARALIRQLVESGVNHLVTSPGYRNSPLILAARKQPELNFVSVVDERGAAFFALGMAKQGERAALLCTSGTAVANYFPAIMEAFHSHCPLLVITADRPTELVGSGANQCTDQVQVFGKHTRGFLEISSPAQGLDSENAARYSLARAAALSLAPVPGPVHVNVRFREPFLPDASAFGSIESAAEEKKQNWKILPSASGPAKEQWEAVEAMFQNSRRPLFLAGPGFSLETQRRILRLTEKTGFPVLAENASGLPFQTGKIGGSIIRHPERLLAKIAAGKLEAPDLLVRLGAPLTGKGHGALLKAIPLPQIIFEENGEAREPHLYPSIFVQGGLDGWLSAFERSDLRLADSQWRAALEEEARSIDEKLQVHLERGQLTEWKFHHGLEKFLSDQSLVFLGNSMPIRDFNSAFPPSKKSLSLHSNRGLSGIDGLLATAAGLAFASQQDTHGIVGDLSALHDLPSFSILSSLKDKICLTVWVMNNEGGEIFRIVPTAKTAGQEEWFTTPQPFDLASLAKAFRIPYLRIANLKEWQELDPTVCSGPGARIIEVVADKETNLSIRQGFEA